jgi:glutathione S-transferase
VTPRLTLVQYPGLSRGATLSPPCGKAQMALRFKHLEFDVRNVGGPWQAKRYNPRGRVPVLLVDDVPIVDSTDILTELDRRFPERPLAPRVPRDAMWAKILEDWADEVLYFYAVYLRWCVKANVARMRRVGFAGVSASTRWLVAPLAIRIVRSRARKQGVGLKDEATVEREFDECLTTIEQMLAVGPWLAGPDPSRADLAVCAVLDQLRIERLTPDAASAIGARSALREWTDRLHVLAPSAAG